MNTLQDAQKLVFEPLSLTAVSTDVGIELQYFGAQDYADVAVDATTGDVTLKHGVSSTTEVVDTSVGLPVASPGTGILDVSDAQANTVGEVLDHLNCRANWRARPVAMRRADLMTNTLITLAQTQCNAALGLLRDSIVAVQTNTYTIGLRVTRKTLAGCGDGGFINRITEISGVASTTTPGTGTGYDDGEGALNDLRVVVYTINDLLKTQTRIWHSDPLVSGVAFSFTETDWGNLPLSGDPGEALLVLIQNSGTGATTITSPSLTVKGYREQAGGMARTERWHLSSG